MSTRYAVLSGTLVAVFLFIMLSVYKQNNKIIEIIKKEEVRYYCRIYAKWGEPWAETSVETTSPRMLRALAEMDSVDAMVSFKDALEEKSYLDSLRIEVIEDKKCFQCNNKNE